MNDWPRIFVCIGIIIAVGFIIHWLFIRKAGWLDDDDYTGGGAL